MKILLRLFVVVAALAHSAHAAADAASIVPAAAPRTLVPAGRLDAFRAYCLSGDGAAPFAKLRADLDRDFSTFVVPPEPVTYGDPSPSKRSSDMADLWRGQQDVAGRISGVAEAAALSWLVTGEEKYFAHARAILLAASAWTLGPPGRPVDWRAGPVPGAADVYYNDEAHFRLWRKLPLVYDQLRAKLSPADRATILAHFKLRGTRSAVWIEQQGNISKIVRNSIAADLSSHPVRFMPMTGLAGLALWDDLPEAREWWAFAYKFYRDQFTPWGGDDGGWGEGSAYWRGVMEHSTFQDALLALGDPLAYASPFWKNTPFFPLYNVQPYLHTIVGETANAGRFNLEPATADYLTHLARVQQNGFLLSYAALCTDTRPRPIDKGLAGLDRGYPTAAEFLVRNFLAAGRPLPAPRPLAELPPHRYFADVGWVSLHSALGRPADDIHVTFRASPYGSFSHSHADQLGFILNAYGEGLAINSAYREFHNSPHHEKWTRQSVSKNVILLDGVGQKPKSKDAVAKITRFETTARTVLTTGDATPAYQAAQKEKGRVRRVTRDLVFVDQRYVVLRDRIELATPARLSWLLHAEKHLAFDGPTAVATIRGLEGKATLTVQILATSDRIGTSAPNSTRSRNLLGDFSENSPRSAASRTLGQNLPQDSARDLAVAAETQTAARALAEGFPLNWTGTVTNEFPVSVDPKYTQTAGSPYITGAWHNHAHLALESAERANSFTVYSVLWPERGAQPAAVSATLAHDGTLTIKRPDGRTDTLVLSDDSLVLR